MEVSLIFTYMCKSIYRTDFVLEKQQEILQTDYTNLKYIQQQLEEALEELKEPYSIRVKRNM